MFSTYMMHPREQYLNHSHTPTLLKLFYSPIPSILCCLKWQADRPSLLHHRPAADYDDPTLSCAQCPGEAPRSVLPRTVPWRVAHGFCEGAWCDLKNHSVVVDILIFWVLHVYSRIDVLDCFSFRGFSLLFSANNYINWLRLEFFVGWKSLINTTGLGGSRGNNQPKKQFCPCSGFSA